MAQPHEPALTASHKLEYSYKRSLGPVLSRFFTGLRDRKLFGIRRADGSILMPPREYDPDTSESLDDVVEVASEGVVKSWSWVAKPRTQQPLDRPFAYALVQLDETATPFLHVVDAGSPEKMTTGMRVRARWIDAPQGLITDFVFEPA